MANIIEEAESNPSYFVPPTSRYMNSKVLLYSEQKFVTFSTYKRQSVRKKDDQFAVIPAGQEYRPDLTSNEMYGVPDYWWKIMEVNGLMDIMQYKAGLTIRLPRNL